MIYPATRTDWKMRKVSLSQGRIRSGAEDAQLFSRCTVKVWLEDHGLVRSAADELILGTQRQPHLPSRRWRTMLWNNVLVRIIHIRIIKKAVLAQVVASSGDQWILDCSNGGGVNG